MIQKLISKYQTLSLPLKATLWFLIASVLQQSIHLITVPLYTRLVSSEDFGMFSLYKAWMQIIAVFASLKVYSGIYFKGMLKYKDNQKEYTSSMQGLSTISTILVFLFIFLIWFFYPNLIGLDIRFLTIMGIQIIAMTSFSLWSSQKRFNLEYKSLVFLTIIISVFNPLFGLLAIYYLSDNALALIFAFAFANISVGIILYIYNLYKGKVFASRIYWKYAFSFNVLLIPHYLSIIVLAQSDRIMINYFGSNKEVAYYSVVYSGVMILNVLKTSINKVFAPWSYKVIDSKNYFNLRRYSSLILIFIFSLILVFIFLGPEILYIFAPKEYQQAVIIIPPVASSVFFMFLYTLFANVEFYYHKNKFILIASIIVALLNIVLNYIFIPKYGYIAAGYTTLVSYIFYALGHYFFMKVILKMNNVNTSIYNEKLILLLSGILVLNIFIAPYYLAFLWLRILLLLIVVITLFFIKNSIHLVLKSLWEGNKSND